MKRLRILHVGYIDDRRFSGVATVVPNYLKYQARHADVALLNISSYIPDHSVGAYKTFTYGKLPLDDIMASFGALDLVVFHEVYRPEFVRIAEKLRSVGVPYIITPHVSLTNTAQNHKWLKKRIGNALVLSLIHI